MKVLVLLAHYLPGFKAGGPTRSIANLVTQLGEELDFHIVTSDRDRGDTCPYPDVERNVWQRVGKAQVAYISPSFASFSWLVREVRRISPDLIYLNSLFDWRRFILPSILKYSAMIPHVPIVIAPRGEAGAGALKLNKWKKVPYLAAFKALGLHTRVHWHATSAEEALDIKRLFGPHTRIQTAPNLCHIENHSLAVRKAKRPGEMRLVFLSRVAKKKNLLGALDMLRSLPGQVSLDVWGPIEDATYWRQCQEKIARLPPNVAVLYHGSVAPDRVSVTLAQFDALLLPTYDENFGHVIVEAWAAGCPVVISDQTPWHGLQQLGVGWDLPLDSVEAFGRALSMLCSMDEPAHRTMRSKAAAFGRALMDCPESVVRHRQLFEAAITQPNATRRNVIRQAA